MFRRIREMENLPGRGCAVNGGHGLRVRVAFGLPSLTATSRFRASPPTRPRTWSIKGTWSVAKQNNYALNPSFEADRIAVTQAVGWKATNSANAKGGHTGNWSRQLTGSATLSQSVASLPNGSYKLSVWAKSSAAGATLYVKNDGVTMTSKPIPAGTSWSAVTLEGITVTSGQAELGVTSSGQTLSVDDFSPVAE